MKVAISINTSWNIYNFRSGLVRALQGAGHDVLCIAPEDAYSAKLIEMGCDFRPVKMQNKGSNPIKDMMLLRQYRQVFTEERPDIIFQYTIKPNIYGTLAARTLGIPTVNNVSGLGTVFIHDNLTSKVARSLYRFAFQFPRTVFFQNEDDRKLFVELGLVRQGITDILPGSGVDLEKFRPEPFSRNRPFRFLLIGRLLYDKGLVEFAKAIEILREKGHDHYFEVVGFTDFESNMGVSETLLKEWQGKGLFTYHGPTDNIQEKIGQADCIVLPSYREGTPRTLLEAAAMGKPIITTNVPGCKEVVVDRENGFLCEVRSPESLADAMGRMAEMDDLDLKRMAIASRIMAERKFDEKLVLAKYLKRCVK